MADQGLKVSQPGFDVKTATDSQISFSSKYNLLKVYAQGSVTLVVPTDDVFHTVTISHNLGYRPAFFCFGVMDPSSGNRYSIPAYNSTSSPVDPFGDALLAKSDNNTLYISGLARSGGGVPASYTAKIYYYIFYDKGGV